MIRTVSLSILLATALPSRAIVFLETADPLHNITSPGDNSGWQYEGKFGIYLGIPIAPHFFITADHIKAAGTGLDFHGDFFQTIASHPIPDTDLVIWEIDHAKPFRNYAPLSSGAADVGATAMVIGRGTRRGDEVIVGGTLKGWKNGVADNVQRWGKNVIPNIYTDKFDGRQLLQCDFNKPGITDECHLTTGDSGGGLFVLEDGLWRLAGINYAVDGDFRIPPETIPFRAALFDVGGLEVKDGSDYDFYPDTPNDIASSFYCSRISASLNEIAVIAPETASLAPEDFSAWRTLYFSPAQIADPDTSGPLSDSDADGISNLLEYALNLDPVVSEHALMTSATGLRGLPLVKRETVACEEILTIEFVRRTAAAVATPQFSEDLTSWSAAASETVTPINPRWERVKAIAPGASIRFARLKIELPD